MNFYEKIKQELINNEINRKVKSYSINKRDLDAYYKVGKILTEAGSHYGDGIIREYSKRLSDELGKKYSVRYLFDIRKLYIFSKVHPLNALLTMSHYRLLFPLNDNNEINYYIDQVVQRNLSKRQLELLIKNKEYERLPENTRVQLFNKSESSVVDFVKDPIMIKNYNNYKKYLNEY